MGRRRTRRANDTLRHLLLKDHREKFGPTGRWHIPGRVSDYEQALVAGEPIVIDSGTIMCALMHAGLPSDDYAFGGRHWGKQWLLDDDGTLSEWTVEDSIEYGIDDPRIEREPGKQCKGGRTCQHCDRAGSVPPAPTTSRCCSMTTTG